MLSALTAACVRCSISKMLADIMKLIFGFPLFRDHSENNFLHSTTTISLSLSQHNTIQKQIRLPHQWVPVSIFLYVFLVSCVWLKRLTFSIGSHKYLLASLICILKDCKPLHKWCDVGLLPQWSGHSVLTLMLFLVQPTEWIEEKGFCKHLICKHMQSWNLYF